MSSAASVQPYRRCVIAARNDSEYAEAKTEATNSAASHITDTRRLRKSETTIGSDAAAGANHIMAEIVMDSIFYGFAQVFLLVDFPYVVNAVAVEIDDCGRRGAETMLRRLRDLDKVVGAAAVGDQRRLFESGSPSTTNSASRYRNETSATCADR